MALNPGTRLGPYEILGTVGSGGMGEVYRARDPRLSRDVAIKVMSPEWANDAEWLRRFEQEARATASLSHPNILSVYDIGKTDGVSYLVTELLEGETLRARLAQGALPVLKAVAISQQILSGLSAAHTRGIVHRDLKPDNIFLTRAGQTKILDFGLAKVTKVEGGAEADIDPTLVSQPGLVVGTASYMAPEQARGLAADARSDLFSFGTTLYEMLCGQRAFKRDSVADTVSAILKEDPTSLSRRGIAAPPSLVRIMNRCLEKDPADRFQSARDVSFALESISDVHVEPASAPEKKSEKSIAVLPFSNLGGDTEQDYFSDGLAEELITGLASLKGLRVASRTSAFRFRGRDLDIREIGRQLNVETVLEGSIRRAGKRLRVTVQLINIADGYQLWSQRYDRELEDVFAIQDEITESIVKTLKPTLLGEQQPVARRHTDNLEAFELYLKGRHSWQQRTEISLRGSVEYFSKAIALDPDYALAHAGIADSYSILRVYGYVTKDEAKAKVNNAAKRAMELDPNLAESHFAAALFKMYFTEDWPDAEPLLRRAIEISPRTALFHAYFAAFCGSLQRAEDVRTFTANAAELDPLSPFVAALSSLAMWMVRDYEGAVRSGSRALELQPGQPLALLSSGLALCKLGQYDLAVETIGKAVAVSPSTAWFIGAMGMVHALAGRRAEALALRERLVRQSRERYVSPYSLLEIDLGLDDRDQVFKDLQMCLDDEVTGLVLVFIFGGLFDPLFGEPRFDEMLRRFRVPPPPR